MGDIQYDVESEQQAFELLERYLNGQGLPEKITFNGWPSLTLQRAEWERKPVHLSINAKHVDGDIKSAVILYVKDVYNKPE